MSTTLLDKLRTKLGEGLQRRASTSADLWAENYVILGKPIPGPMRFDHHPWSRPWCATSKSWVGKKSSQMAMTNSCLIRSLFTIDILRNDVLYVLPKAKPDAADFSKSKFDILLNLSPHLTKMFNNVQNVGHKQAGEVNFYLRGSRSRSGLKSVSTGLKIFDEFDEMLLSNLPLAEERSTGYTEKDIQTIKISTPTFPDYGISKEYDHTNKQHYIFKCPSCSKLTELIYPECVVVTTDNPYDEIGLRKSYLQCNECRTKLPGTELGFDPSVNMLAKMSWINERNCNWEITDPTNSLDGYWIHAFYSIVRPLHEIAKKIIESRTDETIKSELYNSILAKDYVAEGARVSVQQVEACKSNHQNHTPATQSKLVTMGVDVGHKVLYYHIDEWLLPPNALAQSNINNNAIARARSIGIVSSFHELAQLLFNYQILHTIIDVDPESREAINFAEAFPGKVNLCRFVSGIKKKSVNVESKGDGLVVQVNRTTWLDISQGRYIKGHKGIILPNNTPTDYPKHISALIKQQKKDDEGNLKSKYINVGADHWAFARVYSEIALPLAISVSENKDIHNFL